jgi:hypothetical protein
MEDYLPLTLFFRFPGSVARVRIDAGGRASRAQLIVTPLDGGGDFTSFPQLLLEAATCRMSLIQYKYSTGGQKAL